MEVRMRHSSNDWSCKVSLRFETDKSGKPVESVKEISFGDVLSDPKEVEAILRRAQLAILNPSVTDVAYFLGMNDEDVQRAKQGNKPSASAEQLTFSTNVVCVDVVGSAVTDLTCLDLPGLIAHSKGEKDVQLIENMVRKAIRGECLILLAITMKDDFQNQKSVVLAQEEDPERKRTIGVLTKADTLGPGEHESWLAMLEGRENALVNDYFVTKQPDQADLKRICSHIEAKLPAIQNRVNAVLAQVLSSIKALPAAPSTDPIADVHLRLSTLTRELERLSTGLPGHLELVVAKNKNEKHFKECIKATKPIFHAVKVSSADSKTSANSEKDKGVDAFPPLEKDLQEVRTHLETHRSRELTLSAPFAAKVALMTESTQHWPALTFQALDGVRQPVEEALSKAIERAFGRGTNEKLRGIVKMIVSDTLQGMFDEATTRLEQLSQLQDVPTTLNDHYFKESVTSALSSLKAAKKPKPPALDSVVQKSHDSKLNQAVALLNETDYPGLKKEELPRLNGPDEWEEELAVMAETTAYWKVAYKRITDEVPSAIDHAIILNLPSTMQHALLSRLLSGDQENVKGLFAEIPDVADERADLDSRRKRLETAKKVLARQGL
ncbi:hypothetical protein JCM6882_000799 [Rhodosporidiobolus microsporus]